MSGIGESPPRPDGFAKVSGAARYVDDVSLPGMWHGATVRSPHPHAHIRSIRFDPALAPPGTVCVIAADLPGPNGVQLLDDGWPILADRMTLHVGEPVALVAAPTRLAARQALAAVAVEYEPLAPALTLAEAEALPPLYELRMENGDVEAALAAADRVVEGESRTGHQEHIYIECQGMIAWFEDDTLNVLGSMQCPYYVHKALVHAFRLQEERVRVRASVVGGGFGGKEDFPSAIAIHAALLARAAGRPVKIVYDRNEDIVGTSKRHPSVIRHRTGVDRDGRLLALDADILFDGGAYSTLSPVVLSRALLHSFGPYRWPAARIRGRVLRTHTAPNSAFRGFGAPQVEFAIERQMDRIARELGLDPFEVRARNVVEPGDRLPTGQVLDPSTSARACLEEAERRTGFRARWKALEGARESAKDGERRRGIGLSLFFHGAGFTGNGERKMRSPVTARLLEDGRIEVLTAMTDMGQGCVAIFPQIASSAAGVGTDDLVFAEPDTSQVPDSGPTVASRTTMIVGGAIARAVIELRDRVLAARGEGLSVRDGWIVGPEGQVETFREAARAFRRAAGPVEVTTRHEPPDWQTFDESTYRGAAYPTYAWGADVVEVEVDPDTLYVHPVQATAVCEVGKAIHPVLCAGQIEGGTLQAIGWALMEEVKLQDGRYLNDRLATYIIPTIQDSPKIDVHLLERAWEGGSFGAFGAKGVGELPMDGGAPAAAQAIENATGIPVDEIPATPEKLLARGNP
jgi:CO/xanthine dehydrogenase Mo-binding subunit